MPDPSLHRTNINLYAADVEWLRSRYGFGWTERVREIVRSHIHATEERKELTDPEIAEDVLEDKTRTTTACQLGYHIFRNGQGRCTYCGVDYDTVVGAIK